MEELKEKIESREKNSENILSKLSEQKMKKLKEEKNKKKLREEQVIQNLIKEQERQEKNRKIFYNKQLSIEQNVFLKTLELKEKSQIMKNKLNNKYSLTLENKKHLETETLKKKATTLRRIELIDERIKDNQKKTEANFIKKREEERLKLYEKTLSIERKNRLTQFNNMKKMRKFSEKDKKLEDIKTQKELLDKEKSKIEKEIQIEKDEILQKVQKMMSQKTEISPEFIRKMFPDDEELYNKVVKLQKKHQKEEERINKKYGFYGTYQNTKTSVSLKKQSRTMNTSISSPKVEKYYNLYNSEKVNKTIENSIKEEKSHFEDSSFLKNSISISLDEKKKKEEEEQKIAEEKERIKKEKKEKEIKNKIEEYKANLQKEFEKLILEEKQKEDERVTKYEEEQDSTKKLLLEKNNSVERAEGTHKIEEAKEKMDKKVEEFELNLRKNL